MLSFHGQIVIHMERPIHNIFFGFLPWLFLKTSCNRRGLHFTSRYLFPQKIHPFQNQAKCALYIMLDMACSRWQIPALWTCITLEKKACTLDESQGSQHVLHLRRLVVVLIDHKLFSTCITLKRTSDPWEYHKYYFTHYTWECIKTHQITETLFRWIVINANGIIPIYLSHTRYSGMKKVFEHYGPSSFHMVYSSLIGAY